MKTTFAILSLLAVAGFAAAAPDGPVLGKTAQGTPELGRIDCLSFAPGGVLLIGDGQKRQILAVATEDAATPDQAPPNVSAVRRTLAGRLGTAPEQVEILDMAVHPVSLRPYLAIRKQDEKAYLIVRLDAGGEPELVVLEDVSYARVALPEGDAAPVNRITDLAWSGSTLVAAARCNEEFASKIFALEGPIDHDAAGRLYSAETYHVSHRRWETRAPMSVLISYMEDGEPYIVGAFSCTPVVKYPVSALQPGARVKGISMIELGSGNRPLDMFAYEKDGKGQVISNAFRFHHEKRPFGPSPYLAFRFDEDLLAGDSAVNENATRRLQGRDPATDRIAIAEAYHGVVHMDRRGDDSALVLRESGDDLELLVLPLP